MSTRYEFYDIKHPFGGIEYLDAGHEVDDDVITTPALLLSGDECGVFAGGTHDEMLAYFRRVVTILEAGPVAAPARCEECGDEIGGSPVPTGDHCEGCTELLAEQGPIA